MPVFSSNISGSGTLQAVGATILGSTLTVSGAVSGAALTMTTLAGTELALQNGGISAAGAIGGATTVSASGQTTLGANMLMSGDQYVGGALNVSGNTTLGDTSADVATVTARLTASQGGYFADRVGIGTATPARGVHIYGAGTQRIVVESSDSQAGVELKSDSADSVILYTPDASDGLNFHMGGASVVKFSSAGAISGSGQTTLGANMLMSGDQYVGGALNVSGTATVGGLTALANLDIGAFKMQALTFESDQATGTAPFTVASTTKVTNLNADKLDGSDWAAPAALGSGTPAAVTATTVSGTAATFTTLAGTELALQNGGISAAGAIAGATTYSGSTSISADSLTLGSYGIATAGVLTIASMGGNWTNASRTVANGGTFTTIDINGGTIDGTTVGATTPSSVKATTLSGSSTLQVGDDSTFAGKVEPLVDDGYDIGSASKQWKDLYTAGDVKLSGVASGSQAGPSSFLAVNAAGILVLDEPAGGGSPGGSDTEVQFNDGSSFAGDSAFTFNKTSNVLTVGGLSNAGSTVIDRVSKASGDSPYTTTATDHYIGCDTEGGAITINLRDAATEGEGRVLIIKDETGTCTGSNTITVKGNGSENIDGSNTQVINNGYGSLTLVCANRATKEWAIV